MALANLAPDDPAQISLTLEPWEGELAKKVPGARWNDSDRTWRLGLSWPAAQCIRGVFGHGLQVGDELAAWSREVWERKIGPLTSLRYMEDLALAGPTGERLWPLQRPAAYAMALAEQYAELDEMGGGKTVTTIAALKLAAAMHGEGEVFPALVVCPNKVRRSWRKIAVEVQQDGSPPWWEGLALEVMPKGKPAQRKVLERVASGETKVVVTNWESLRGLSRHEPFGNIELTDKEREPGPLNRIQWRTVVGDEAHRMADRKAKQTRAMKAIAFGTPSVGTGPARFRWLLTGTFIANNSAEAWSLLNFLDPVGWPAYSRFVDRYATTTWNRFGGMEIGGVKPEVREEFYRCLDPISIRRLRQQFDPFKPDRQRIVMTLPMEAKQATAYKAMAKDMLAEMDNGEVLAATNPLVRSSRLRMLANAYGEMADKGRRGDQGEPLLDLQLVGPSNKVNAMLELVEEAGIDGMPGHGSPIVFGAPSRQLIGLCEAALQKKGIQYSLIAGGMTDHDQEASERAFESGETRVCLCVTSAAKEGINSLVVAPTLVHLMKSDSRVDNEQFEARVDRPGQTAAKVTIVEVLSEGTIEEFEQVENLAAKYENFQQVVNDERTLRAMLEFKGE